jgi:hypothetical protein
VAHDVVTPAGEVRKDPNVFEFGGRRVDENFRPIDGGDQAVLQAQPTVVISEDIPPRAKVELKPVRVKAEEPITAGSVVKQLRARLRVVQREILARQALEAEREQIKRLLRAAEENKATVHALRRAAG